MFNVKVKIVKVTIFFERKQPPLFRWPFEKERARNVGNAMWAFSAL